LSYWFDAASPWCCVLAPVSIVLGLIALNKIKAGNGAFSDSNWARQGIGISIFSINAISVPVYLGGKYAWDWW